MDEMDSDEDPIQLGYDDEEPSTKKRRVKAIKYRQRSAYYSLVVRYPGLSPYHNVPQRLYRNDRGQTVKTNGDGVLACEQMSKRDVYFELVERWRTSASFDFDSAIEKSMAYKLKRFYKQHKVAVFYHHKPMPYTELDDMIQSVSSDCVGGTHLHIVLVGEKKPDGRYKTVAEHSLWSSIVNTALEMGGSVGAEGLYSLKGYVAYCNTLPRMFMGTNSEQLLNVVHDSHLHVSPKVHMVFNTQAEAETTQEVNVPGPLPANRRYSLEQCKRLGIPFTDNRFTVGEARAIVDRVIECVIPECEPFTGWDVNYAGHWTDEPCQLDDTGVYWSDNSEEDLVDFK